MFCQLLIFCFELFPIYALKFYYIILILFQIASPKQQNITKPLIRQLAYHQARDTNTAHLAYHVRKTSIIIITEIQITEISM